MVGGLIIYSQDELLYTISCVKSNFSLGDIPVEDVIAHADWLSIANSDVSNH